MATDALDHVEQGGRLTLTQAKTLQEGQPRPKVFGVSGLARQTTEFFGTHTGKKPDFLKMGLDIVDDNIGGIFPGQLAVWGARTGVGKTTTSLYCAERAARLYQVPVGYIPLEDHPVVIGAKLLSFRANVNDHDILKGTLSPAEKERVRKVEEEDLVPVFVPDVLGLSMESVLDYIDALADQGCRVIWLDYLHAITDPAGAQSETQALNAHLATLHEKARERNVALMVVVQVNRPPKKLNKQTGFYEASDRAPHRSDVRGSAMIENKSRLMVLLWAQYGQIYAKIEKSSYGGFEGTTTKFERSNGILRLVG